MATPNETLEEQNFQRIVGTDHMRQWYKHRVAYAMMEDGWRRLANLTSQNMFQEFPAYDQRDVSDFSLNPGTRTPARLEV